MILTGNWILFCFRVRFNERIEEQCHDIRVSDDLWLRDVTGHSLVSAVFETVNCCHCYVFNVFTVNPPVPSAGCKYKNIY